MRARALIGIGTTALLAAAGCGGSSGGTPQTSNNGAPQHPSHLVGDVGHGGSFDISLTDGNGQAITNLAAGSYTLVVKDESSIHNFHLTGGGVDDKTDVPSTGSKTFRVTFTPGTYTFICDAHPTSMKGTFRVS